MKNENKDDITLKIISMIDKISNFLNMKIQKYM